MSDQINQYQIKLDDEVVDVARWVPEEESDEPAIVIAPGWTATFPLIRHILLELRHLNRPIYAVLHPRVRHVPPSEGGYDGTQIKKSEYLLAVIDEYGLEKVDIMSHSSGSLEAIRAAQLTPEFVRSVIMVNPAGLIQKPSLFKFYLRSLVKLFDDTYQSVVAKRRNKDLYKYHYGEGRRYIFWHQQDLHTRSD